MKKQKNHAKVIITIPIVIIFFSMITSAGFPQFKDVLKKTGEGLKNVSSDIKGNFDAGVAAVEAEKELNAAQRDMLSGKKDKAEEGLLKASRKIAEIKKAQVDHPKLNIIEPKMNNLRKDLEKRTGKKIPLPTDPEETSDASVSDKPAAPAAPAAKTAASQPKADISKLPHEIREIMGRVQRNQDRLDTHLDLIPKQRDDIKKSYIERTPDKISEIENDLAKAKSIAAEKNVAEHPSFEQAEKNLADAKKIYEEIKKQADADAQAASAKSEGVDADVEELAAIVDQLKKETFSKAPGVVIYYNDLTPVQECLEVIENFEKNDKEKAQKILDDFTSKYGATKDEVEANMDKLNYSGNRQPGWLIQNLKEGLENVAKTRVVMAEDLVSRLDQQVERLSSNHDFFRIQRHHESRQWLAMAEKFDPENPKVKEAGASLENKLAEDMKKFKEKIADKKWPGNSSGGDAKAALQFFEESPDWGKRPTEPR
ncbi:MAG TPA: hypothetical protein P5557_13460, partial [Candidatus Sumerlaeia bacterium]|nr:hypothetical protein [Candidatus Sumerlaeia bacterium]